MRPTCSRPRRRLRAQGKGGLVTYSPKVFIPLTKLCRDVCHYCTFAAPPRRGERAYLTADEVLAIARAGAEAGCKEALFTLGDKPERRYRAAREELAALGCETTIEYLVRMCRLVLDETGLLPHANPGVMTRDELRALREVTASQGIMLETASDRLSERGGPHFGSPDKVPAVRLETLRLAGEVRIPFTSGILIGIGETRRERIEALLAIRELHEQHGHVQEVIVQNFRAKPGTKMAERAEPSLDELLWTAAAARLVLGPDMNVQCPPNLSYDDFPRLLEAGINDWGGVSPVTIDHVNPEAPWPELERLSAATRAAGLELAPRLPVYPEYLDAEWLDPGVLTAVAARLRRARPRARGRLEPGRREPRAVRARATRCRSTRRDELGEEEIVRLFRARGEERQRVFAAADRLRREVNGDIVTLRRHAEHQLHERLLLQVRLLRVLEGQAGREPARPRVPRPARGDRAARPGGVGARRDRGLPPGRHPPGLRRRLLRIGRPRDQGRAARDPRPRVLGARDLAGRGDARAAAATTTSSGCATPVSPRCRARPPRSSTTRCAP